MPQKRSANRINTLKMQAVDKLTGEGGRKVELEQILKRLAEQVAAVDRNITPTQPHYIPSIGTSSEPTIVERLISEWEKAHPEEMANVVLKKRGNGKDGCFEIKYPEAEKGSRKRLDFGFSSNSAPQGCDNQEDLEWAIEFKKINWVGGTGTDQAERAVGKLCSPYPATGPILDDALRVKKHSYGRRFAVILLSPDVHPDQLEKCKNHPKRKERWYPEKENDRIIALSNTFKKNNGIAFEAEPVLPLVEAIFDYKGIQFSSRIVRRIVDLDSHPNFSRLTIVGWEIM